MDFLEVQNLIIDKLFIEQFPKSDTPFSFQQLVDNLEINNFKVSEENSLTVIFFTEPNNKLIPHIRTELIKLGYLKDVGQIPNDTILTPKGIEAVEHGGIDSYHNYLQKQKELQNKLLQSSVNTNLSVQETNRLTQQNIKPQQNIAIASVLVSAFAAIVATVALLRGNSNELKELNILLQRQLETMDSINHNLKIIKPPTLIINIDSLKKLK